MRHYTPNGWVDDADSIKEWAEERDYKDVLKELDATPENLLSKVVYGLTWNLKDASATITSIPCDQWCAVIATGARYETSGLLAQVGEEERISTFVQCDHVEYGIAKTWKIFAEKFGVAGMEGGDE